MFSPVKSATNLVKNPRKWAGNVWDEAQNVGPAGLNMMTLGAGTVAGMIPRYEEPRRTDYPAPWEMDLSESMAPTPNNPMVSKWRGLAGNIPNLSASQEAAAGNRMANQGFLQLAELAPNRWQQLMSQALDLENARSSIDTTTGPNAFLRGFGGAGGFNAVGSLVGGPSAAGSVPGSSPLDRYF